MDLAGADIKRKAAPVSAAKVAETDRYVPRCEEIENRCGVPAADHIVVITEDVSGAGNRRHWPCFGPEKSNGRIDGIFGIPGRFDCAGRSAAGEHDVGEDATGTAGIAKCNRHTRAKGNGTQYILGRTRGHRAGIDINVSHRSLGLLAGNFRSHRLATGFLVRPILVSMLLAVVHGINKESFLSKIRG
jgi:hypothetical protein